MRKIRNRLLITLVLFGVLSAAAAHAQTVWVQKATPNPTDRGLYDPQPAPTTGEPDVGQTTPQRGNLTSTREGSQHVSRYVISRRTFTSADAIEWALVMWMAQYLTQRP